MINYPNALQPPPSGFTLPDRFLQLTQPKEKGGSAVSRGNATQIGTTGGANSTSPIPTANGSFTSSADDPNFNPSLNNVSLPTNVGQQVLNSDGEVDGSDIGLGKNRSNGATGSLQAPANQGLNTAAEAGVAIGGLAAFALLIIMAFWVRKIRRSSREKRASIFISDNPCSSIHDYRHSGSI